MMMLLLNAVNRTAGGPISGRRLDERAVAMLFH